jgi:hypothetical protein
MAKKPSDAVQFTRESAERVARVVRAAELAPAAASPLTFRKLVQQSASKGTAISFALYTASSYWNVGPYAGPTNTSFIKTILLYPKTINTANFWAGAVTAQCRNNIAAVPLVSTAATQASMTVLAMKSHGEWRLIGVQS